MVGKESNASDDHHSAPTERHDLTPRPLADETLRVSEFDQATPAGSRSAAAQAPPDFIDHFEIRRRLGTGGFGSVYLAHDTKLDRMVALKLLDKLDKESARQMLADETQSASKLRHPHLVTVFQCGEHERGCFIVFEQIPGPDQQSALTLREVMKASEHKRLAPEKAVAIARDVADALSHAHDADVVHRDIKPENILLDDKGSAFLADFGCARRTLPKQPGKRSFVGTFPYMSLEQMDGRWNPQTDIWSLGVVLFEMLAGKRPFASAEKGSTRGPAEAKLNFATAIVGTRQLPQIPDVDADLNAICRKCLRTDPDQRYKSAAALSADLARWQRNEPASCRRVGIVEQTTRWAQRNRTIAVLLTALFLTLSIGLVASTYYAMEMKAAQSNYVSERLNQLDQLVADDFAAAIAELGKEPFREMTAQSLQQRWAASKSLQEPLKQRRQNRLAAAIVRFNGADPSSPKPSASVIEARNYLTLAMARAEDPSEFELLREAAADDESALDSSAVEQRTQQLWKIAKEGPEEDQLGALCALLRLDTNSDAWNDSAELLVERILDQDERQIVGWTHQVFPLSARLVPLFQNELASDNEIRQAKAAIAYATLTSTGEAIAKRIVSDPSPDVVRELVLQVNRDVESRQLAMQKIESLDPTADTTARELANLAACKLSLRGSDVRDSLAMFENDRDPRGRYVFEVDAARYGISPKRVLNWLTKMDSANADPKAIQTSVLAIGSEDVNRLSESSSQQIVEQISALYRDHESAPVHAAAERVLRQWHVRLPELDHDARPVRHGRRRAGRRKPSREFDHPWRLNKLGHTMVRVNLPDDLSAEVTAHEITLGDYGAYVRQRAKHYGDNSRELVWIRRPIEQHLNERSQQVRVDENNGAAIEDQLSEEDGQLPVRLISALQAVAYCVWVSEQEGLPNDQMAFGLRPEMQKEDESLLEAIERNLIGGFQSPLQTVDATKLGYRLPFSAEWEFLFAMPKPIKEAEPRLQNALGWHRGNSYNELRPVAGKRPHDLGVFDVWGNVSEWCITGIESEFVGVASRGPSFRTSFDNLQLRDHNGASAGGHREIGFRMIRAL